MTPERLAAIKEHFKNPPSASCNREWALEVIEALERVLSEEAMKAAHPLMMIESGPSLGIDVAGNEHFAAPPPPPAARELSVALTEKDLTEMLATTPSVNDPRRHAVPPVIIDDRPQPKKKGKR